MGLAQVVGRRRLSIAFNPHLKLTFSLVRKRARSKEVAKKMNVMQDGQPLVINDVPITINGFEVGDVIDARAANMLNSRLISTAIAVAKRRKAGADGAAPRKRSYTAIKD